MKKEKLIPLFLILLSFLLLILPLIFAVFYSIDTIVSTIQKKIVFVLFGISFIILPFILFRPKRVLLLLIPILALGLIEIYVLLTLRTHVTTELFAVIFSDNISEKGEFITANMGFIITGLTILIIYIWMVIFIPDSLKFGRKFKMVVLFYFIGIQGIILSRDYVMSLSGEEGWFNKEALVYSYSVKTGKTFPVNWFQNAHRYRIYSKRLKNYEERIASFHFGAINNSESSEPRLIVLVIGEAARRANFSIYGYERPTSPLLKQVDNLIVMNNAESDYNLTEQVYSVLMSRATIENVELALEEPSVLKAFKEAGFYTVYISNQKLNY